MNIFDKLRYLLAFGLVLLIIIFKTGYLTDGAVKIGVLSLFLIGDFVIILDARLNKVISLGGGNLRKETKPIQFNICYIGFYILAIVIMYQLVAAIISILN
jgi:hypothetical protein